MSHSILPPSSSGIWGKGGGCTGWVGMAQQVPDLGDGEAAAGGEASHEVGAAMIVAAQTAGKGSVAPTLDSLIGLPASNGVLITEEVFEGAELYADDVIREMQSRGIFGGDDLRVEQQIPIPRVHKDAFGTPDAVLADRYKRELILWDYKFGYVPVEAFENWQGICYAAGILDKLRIDGSEEQEWTIEIRIVQPRAHHRDGSVRSWKVGASDLRGKINILAANALKALSAEAELNTGSHCRRCHARYACPAATASGLQLFEAAMSPTPIELSPADLGLQYTIVKRAREQLKGLETGYEEQVKALLRSGVSVPGWGNLPKIGREKWAKPAREVLQLGTLLGVSLAKPDALITPTQARKAGLDESIVAAYSERPQTGLELVPDSDGIAKRIFSS